MIRSWMDLFDADTTCEGFRQALGQDWPEGARVYIGASQRQLPAFTSARLFPGCLVRVLAPQRLLRTMVSCATRLADCDRYLADVSVQGCMDSSSRCVRSALWIFLRSGALRIWTLLFCHMLPRSLDPITYAGLRSSRRLASFAGALLMLLLEPSLSLVNCAALSSWMGVGLASPCRYLQHSKAG